MTAPTQAQIDAATGRGLDALVAEHIMGLRWYQCVTRREGCLFLLTANMAKGFPTDMVEVQPADYLTNDRSIAFAPAYSTDLNAAGLVLERMRAISAFQQNLLFCLLVRLVETRMGVAPCLLAWPPRVELQRAILHATPEDWCRAALVAFLAQKGAA